MDILTALTVMLAFLLVMSLDTPNFSKTLIERVRAAIRTFIAERGSVTFFRESKFFFTLYHAGKVNIILHVVSLSFLFYGLSAKSVPLVLIGLLCITGTLDSVSE